MTPIKEPWQMTQREINRKSLSKWLTDTVPEIKSYSIETGTIVLHDGTKGELGIDMGDKITIHTINLEKKGTGLGTKIFNSIKQFGDIKGKNLAVSKAYNHPYWEKMGFDIKAYGDYPVLRMEYKSHKSIIREALAEGKPVPTEVLMDYPELVGKSTEATVDAAIARAGSKYVKDMRQFLEAVKGKTADEVVAMYPELVGKESVAKGGRKRKGRTPKGGAPTPRMKGLR